MEERGRCDSPAKHQLLLFLLVLAAALSASGADNRPNQYASHRHSHELIRHHSQRLLASLIAGNRPSLHTPSISTPAPSPTRVYYVTDYGADPTGVADSTEAIKRALSDACLSSENRYLMSGISDLGGSELNLGGGTYIISSPIILPSNPVGNLKIRDGSLRASESFPTDRYVIELSSSVVRPKNSYNFELISLSGLMIDANYRGGGIVVINSLRTTITGCYVIHFTSEAIYVQSGHETLITSSFIGQHVTAGADPLERNFSGTGIHLNGNDNIVNDVIIFSAAVGILITGQANTITGVHCYNKATVFGGTGIYLKLPGLTQTRIMNCYMDYTGIVAEDPVQLYISGSFFLGDANVVLKSIKGEMRGVNVVDNMFSGKNNNINIIQLDESNKAFTVVDQVLVARNSVHGMLVRSTVGKMSVCGNTTKWVVDFNPLLLFPNRISSVKYALLAESNFPHHALRSVAENKVLIESDVPVQATLYVQVEQYGGTMG